MDRPTSDSTGSHDEQASGELDPLTDLGTWSALLGHWSALVKAGEGLVLAAPDDADAARWRASIPEVISLQSITFALRDLARLPEADRPLARDRADLTVTASASSLDTIWRGVEMPSVLLDVAADARREVELAVYAGLHWLVASGDDRVRMPVIDLDADPDAGRGTLALMLPGTIVLPGEPVAWWTERSRPPGLAGPEWEAVEGPPVQVYRDLDDDGRVLGDLVTGLDALPPGLPLIAPISLAGEAIGRPTVDPKAWAKANDRAFEGVEDAEVRWEIDAAS